MYLCRVLSCAEDTLQSHISTLHQSSNIESTNTLICLTVLKKSLKEKGSPQLPMLYLLPHLIKTKLEKRYNFLKRKRYLFSKSVQSSQKKTLKRPLTSTISTRSKRLLKRKSQNSKSHASAKKILLKSPFP